MDQNRVLSHRKITIKNEELWLLPEKAIYWPREKAFILADLHIGKAGHFQKNGIAVPAEMVHRDLKRIQSVLNRLDVATLIIVGDMFHSTDNAEWQPFEHWRARNSDIAIELVMGNHDILPESYYQVLDLHTTAYLEQPPFLFIHDTANQHPLFKDLYPIGGHVHPAVKIRGRARQSHTLPCFYFGDDFGLLPAFGSFTGNYVIKLKESERAFIIADQSILEYTGNSVANQK